MRLEVGDDVFYLGTEPVCIIEIERRRYGFDDILVRPTSEGEDLEAFAFWVESSQLTRERDNIEE